jgi:hypothetical protein
VLSLTTTPTTQCLQHSPRHPSAYSPLPANLGWTDWLLPSTLLPPQPLQLLLSHLNNQQTSNSTDTNTNTPLQLLCNQLTTNNTSNQSHTLTNIPHNNMTTTSHTNNHTTHTNTSTIMNITLITLNNIITHHTTLTN